MYVRSMVEAGVLEGLAAVSPGPELSAALDALDSAVVPGDQLVEVLRAQARQCAHEQARLWATMVEVGLAEPVDDPAGPSCDASTARGGPVADWAPGRDRRRADLDPPHRRLGARPGRRRRAPATGRLRRPVRRA